MDHYETGSTKPLTRNIGINWLIASSIPAPHYQNVQQPGDPSHPGMRARPPTTTNALSITTKTMTTTKTTMTTETTNRTDATNPPQHHDKHPTHASRQQAAPNLPPNMNPNNGSTTPIFAHKPDIACFIHSQLLGLDLEHPRLK
jgi:hypothetical protein